MKKYLIDKKHQIIIISNKRQKQQLMDGLSCRLKSSFAGLKRTVSLLEFIYKVTQTKCWKSIKSLKFLMLTKKRFQNIDPPHMLEKSIFRDSNPKTKKEGTQKNNFFILKVKNNSSLASVQLLLFQKKRKIKYQLFLHSFNNIVQKYLFSEIDLQDRTVYGSLRIIVKISPEVKKGVYAPLTETGNFFVFTTDKKKTCLVHCLAHTRNPKIALKFVNAAIKVRDYFNESPKSGEHSMGTWLRQNLGFLAQ